MGLHLGWDYSRGEGRYLITRFRYNMFIISAVSRFCNFSTT